MSHKTILNDKGRMERKKDSDGAAETRWRRPDLLAMLDDFARERKGDPRIRRIETFVCVRGFPEDYSWPEPGDLLVLQIIGGTTFRAVAMAWNERGTYGICPGMSTEMEFDPREIDRLLVTDMSSTGGMGVPLDVMNWKTDAPDRIEACVRTAFERWREKNLSRVLREHTQLMIGDEFLSLARGGIVESEEERCSCLASDPERAELARAREALTVLTEAGIPPDWERLQFAVGAKTLYGLAPRGDFATARFVAKSAREIEIGEWATWRDRALVNCGVLAFAHWDEALRSRGSLRGFKSYLQMLRWPAIYFALEGSSAAGPDAPSESDATATPGPEAGGRPVKWDLGDPDVLAVVEAAAIEVGRKEAR